jgi:L-rhamnose mutarotase
VREHLNAHGITAMEIYRLGTRMVMLMETDDACYNADAMALATRSNPRIREWEELMWKFQAPTPWTPEGEKWVAMTRIFAL